MPRVNSNVTKDDIKKLEIQLEKLIDEVNDFKTDCHDMHNTLKSIVSLLEETKGDIKPIVVDVREIVNKMS